MNEIHIIVDIIGWAGAGVLLFAYLFVSNGKMAAKSYIYQGLNAFASICLIYNTYTYGTIPLVALNTAWLLISLNTIRTILMAPKAE
jgi:hypothetical protein